MGGQPGIYKLEKALFFGVKDLLKKTSYAWWPPQQFKLYSLGRFDLYPLQYANSNIEQIQKKQNSKTQVDVVKTNLGCFHLKHLLSVREQ